MKQISKIAFKYHTSSSLSIMCQVDEVLEFTNDAITYDKSSMLDKEEIHWQEKMAPGEFTRLCNFNAIDDPRFHDFHYLTFNSLPTIGRQYCGGIEYVNDLTLLFIVEITYDDNSKESYDFSRLYFDERFVLFYGFEAVFHKLTGFKNHKGLFDDQEYYKELLNSGRIIVQF